MTMTVAEAVRKLRELSGENQQYFATRLRMPLRSLQKYEYGDSTPEPQQLLAFAGEADRLDNDELYMFFLGDVFMDQLKPPPGYDLTINFKRTPPRRKGSK
jgi:transcriptional regulator with XRE-family HTH domain